MTSDPHDPADSAPEQALSALLDALADLDAVDDSLEPTPDEVRQAQRLAHLEFDIAVGRRTDETEVLAEITVDEIEDWLADGAPEVVRARGPVSLSTIDRTVPELRDAGYTPDVEVDVDVSADDVTVSVQHTIAADAAALELHVVDHAGTNHRARVNQYGLASVKGVARGPFRLVWRHPAPVEE